jgi:hypothetical protein
MNEKLVEIIEQMAASDTFDEQRYNEFYSLLNEMHGDRGLLGVAADELTEYYACWRQNDRTILATSREALEIRGNLRVIAEALHRNISSFRSFKELRAKAASEQLNTDISNQIFRRREGFVSSRA